MCRARMGSLTFPKQISLKFRTYRRRILGSFRHMILNSIHFLTTITHSLGIKAFKREVVH